MADKPPFPADGLHNIKEMQYATEVHNIAPTVMVRITAPKNGNSADFESFTDLSILHNNFNDNERRTIAKNRCTFCRQR